MSNRSKRNHRALFLGGVAAAALCLTAPAVAAATVPQKVHLSIPSSDLGDALIEFARQSRLSLLYSPELVRGRMASPVRGEFEPAEALQRLLAGSGRVARPTPSGAFVISELAGQRRPELVLAAAPASSLLVQSAPTQVAEVNNVEEVVVTSTRIIREGYNAPTPLTVLGAERIETQAGANIQTFITTLPVVGSSRGNRQNTNGGQNAGLSTINLRGLGANRTLVLLDGRRMTPAHENGTIDINLVPQQLISRVDVVTGGASAVYGSDAIAGVVNFVLDKTYTGTKGEISGGMTHYEDGENIKLAVTHGRRFAGDRGHVMVSGEVVRDEGIRTASDEGRPARNWQNYGVQNIRNPAYAPGNGQPERLIIGGVGYSQAALGGIIATGPLRGIAFGEGGVPFMQDNGTLADSYQIGGSWQRNNPRLWNDLAPSESRYSVFGRASYDLTDRLNVYAQYSWVRADIKGTSQPAAFVGNAGPLIQIDNAYLHPTVRAQMQAANVTNFRLGHLNQDLGILILVSDRRMQFFTVGANGSFNLGDQEWNFDAYASKGKTTGYLQNVNNLSRTRYHLAADAVVHPTTGQIVCRSALTNPTTDCRPINLMGIGVTTQIEPGAQYVRDESWEILDMRQDAVGASITGEPFSVPAGPVSLALSAEYRKDVTNNTADPGSLAADHPFGTFPQTRGESDVWEYAAETVVPITSADSGLGVLEVSGGIRRTHYSYSGNVTTWKAGGTYSPTQDFTFRVTRSRDIRAPNHSELFLLRAGTTGGTAVTDPFTNTSPIAQMFSEGNLNLKPESADTLGAGVVFQPTWFPGFSASMDYWDIRLKDSIGTVNGQNTVNLCFNGERPDLCQNVFRNAAGVITGITSPYVNLARRHMRGLDFEASYRTDLGFAPGAVALHGNATHSLKDITTSPGTLPNDALDVITGAQKWRYTASVRYELDRFNTTLAIRGHSGGMINSNYIACTSACPASTLANPTVNVNRVPSAFYLDWAMNYELELWGRQSVVFFNIRNLENKPQPDLVVFSHQHNTGGWGEYDTDGRVYRLGLRFRM